MDPYDLAIIRLQYELLNEPLASLANMLGCSIAILEQEAKTRKWKQLWPEKETEAPTDEDNPVDTAIEQYTISMHKRLAAYEAAKRALLAVKYASVEVKLLSKVELSLETNNHPTHLGQLSRSFKDICASVSNQGGVKAGIDTDGLPYVVVKDLCGSN